MFVLIVMFEFPEGFFWFPKNFKLAQHLPNRFIISSQLILSIEITKNTF